MMSLNAKALVTLTVMSLFLGIISMAMEELDVRRPPLDKEGRFWVYRNGKRNPPLMFIPYGYMPSQASEMLSMDLECKENPYQEKANQQPSESSEEEMCISVKVKWTYPYWCGVAFISGPDAPQWWGEDNRGWYYDLRMIKKKKLVFYARGATGNERIQVKVGILGDKPYGDSLPFPVQTRWLKLSTQWTRFELDLSKQKPENLQRICNGFTFVLSQDQQENPNTPMTQFYLDHIYFE